MSTQSTRRGQSCASAGPRCPMILILSYCLVQTPSALLHSRRNLLTGAIEDAVVEHTLALLLAPAHCTSSPGANKRAVVACVPSSMRAIKHPRTISRDSKQHREKQQR